jgi:choline dehydrogenase-like flavoprotein
MRGFGLADTGLIGTSTPPNRAIHRSVLNGKLEVYGVDGLRVADASILPRVTTGNTVVPCVVIGEQAAAILQKEQAAGLLGEEVKH